MTAILIVEDDVLANEHLEFILQQAGYEVLSATSADEAAELLEDHDDVRLIVTDINLPGTINGLKLAAAAKARRPKMNIIIVTGYNAPEDDPASEPIRSKTVQCPKDDRGGTAFSIAAPAEVDGRGRSVAAAKSRSSKREDRTVPTFKTLTLPRDDSNSASAGPKSFWTQQEIGFAVARGVKIISFKMGEDPTGFISKHQALPRLKRSAEDIAKEVNGLLLHDERTATRLKEVIDANEEISF